MKATEIRYVRGFFPQAYSWRDLYEAVLKTSKENTALLVSDVQEDGHVLIVAEVDGIEYLLKRIKIREDEQERENEAGT